MTIFRNSLEMQLHTKCQDYLVFVMLVQGTFANSKIFNLMSVKISTKIILKKSNFQNFFIDFIATNNSVAHTIEFS